MRQVKGVFKKGDSVPGWLVAGAATFGCDVLIEEDNGEIWVSPAKTIRGDECLVRFPGTPPKAPFRMKTVLWTKPRDEQLPQSSK